MSNLSSLSPKFTCMSVCILLLFSLSLGVHATGQIEETAEDGKTTSAYTRIVSLAPAVTEMLYAVGAAEQIVGVTEYCNYPPEAVQKDKIGGFSAKTISLEAVVALEPDLVIGIRSMHERVVAPLEAGGLKVVLLQAASFDQVFRAIEEVGAVTGHVPTATELIEGLRSRMQAVTDAVSDIPTEDRKTVFWEIWDNPLMTAGPNTFIGQAIEKAGARNIFADTSGDWPQVSLEEVIKRNPDVVISSNSHGGKLGLGEIAERPGWDQIEAVREGRLFLLPDDLLSRPGPRVVDGLELTAGLVYPEIFN